MMNILLVIHMIVSLLLIVSILLQKTSSDSIANLAGNSGGLVSAKGAANFLTRTTAVLGAIFMINALVLGNLSNQKSSKVIEIEKTLQKTSTKELPMAK